jgi:2-dehydropantoate 2-reductase
VLAPLLSTDAIVLSMQNGVDNVERMYRAAGIRAFGAAVYVAVATPKPGQVKHTGRGDLVIGDPLAEAGLFPVRPEGLATLETCFSTAGIPCRIAENIRGELWTKLAMNCAYNAVSALTEQRYGAVMRDPLVHEVMERVLDETLAVAAKTGVTLSRDALLQTARGLGAAMIDALSSTAQDLLAGKPTEIDSLNGVVADLGEKSGVATPVNRTLHALVKLAENVRVGTPDPQSSR